jgi:actin-related protein 8
VRTMFGPAHPDFWLFIQVLRIGDPESAGFVVRQPVYNRNFNLRDYPSVRLVLSDMEVMIQRALQEKYELQQHDYKVRPVDWCLSPILIVP